MAGSGCSLLTVDLMVDALLVLEEGGQNRKVFTDTKWRVQFTRLVRNAQKATLTAK